MLFEIEYPDGRSEQTELYDKVIKIGRGSGCQLQVKADGISREHVKVELKSGNYFVTDLKSSNGTKIQGKKIPQSEAIEWQTIFPIEIGAGITITLLPDEGVIGGKTSALKKKKIDEDLTCVTTKTKTSDKNPKNDQDLYNVAFEDGEEKPSGNLKVQIIVFLIVITALIFLFLNPDIYKRFISI